MDPKTIFAFLFTLIFPVLLLVLSEDLLWPAGWIFSLWFTLLCFSTILYLYKKDQALLAERYQKPGAGNQERWDRYVVYGIVAGFTVWILIMPLDAMQFGWSPLVRIRKSGNRRWSRQEYTDLSGTRCISVRSSCFSGFPFCSVRPMV